MILHTRDDLADFLMGNCLEIGPGLSSFPHGLGSSMSYADRSLNELRDEIWPELSGQPKGIQPDFEVDLDKSGLQSIPLNYFSSIVASHVIEHLANPINLLTEAFRILKKNGRIILIVPNREKTFDRLRQPTDFLHIFNEYNDGVTQVSDDHILEFCNCIYSQPPIHPEKVREWYNPLKINKNLIELHRKRTIHVHCWNFGEFSAVLANLILQNILSINLQALYVHDDLLEFGYVLDSSDLPLEENFKQFKDTWLNLISELEDSKKHVFDFNKNIC